MEAPDVLPAGEEDEEELGGPLHGPPHPWGGWLSSQLTNHPEKEKDLGLAPAEVGESGDALRPAVHLEGVDEAGDEEVEAVDDGC